MNVVKQYVSKVHHALIQIFVLIYYFFYFLYKIGQECGGRKEAASVKNGSSACSLGGSVAIQKSFDAKTTYTSSEKISEGLNSDGIQRGNSKANENCTSEKISCLQKIKRSLYWFVACLKSSFTWTINWICCILAITFTFTYNIFANLYSDDKQEKLLVDTRRTELSWREVSGSSAAAANGFTSESNAYCGKLPKVMKSDLWQPYELIDDNKVIYKQTVSEESLWSEQAVQTPAVNEFDLHVTDTQTPFLHTSNDFGGHFLRHRSIGQPSNRPMDCEAFEIEQKRAAAITDNSVDEISAWKSIPEQLQDGGYLDAKRMATGARMARVQYSQPCVNMRRSPLDSAARQTGRETFERSTASGEQSKYLGNARFLTPEPNRDGVLHVRTLTSQWPPPSNASGPEIVKDQWLADLAPMPDSVSQSGHPDIYFNQLLTDNKQALFDETPYDDWQEFVDNCNCKENGRNICYGMENEYEPNDYLSTYRGLATVSDVDDSRPNEMRTTLGRDYIWHSGGDGRRRGQSVEYNNIFAEYGHKDTTADNFNATVRDWRSFRLNYASIRRHSESASVH